MKVITVSEFLGIPKGTVGDITDRDGNVLETMDTVSRVMWIKFECKDRPVGIPDSFDIFVNRI